jgi:hypothetical protein
MQLLPVRLCSVMQVDCFKWMSMHKQAVRARLRLCSASSCCIRLCIGCPVARPEPFRCGAKSVCAISLSMHADEALYSRQTGHKQSSSGTEAEDCIRCLILRQPQPLCIAPKCGPTRLHRLLLHASTHTCKPVCNTSAQPCS